jgi:arylsulfatase A-like enzyme
MGPLAQALLDGTADPEDSTYMNALYLGEVAYMDSQVGRLLEGLKQRDLLEETLLVVTADHGEVLSEDSFYAYSHGGDVTDGVMRIPLIMRAYGLPFPKGRIVNRQASLAGLAPTIERVLGLEMRLGDRRDFWDLIRPGPVRVDEGWPERGTEPVFMEASRPRQMEPETGWNNRLFYRSVRAGGYSMVGAPVFEIPYTLSGTEEGGEGLLLWLRYMMARWDSIAPTLRVDTPMAPSTKKALEALGYLE